MVGNEEGGVILRLVLPKEPEPRVVGLRVSVGVKLGWMTGVKTN